jgi:hypothetical protein
MNLIHGLRRRLRRRRAQRAGGLRRLLLGRREKGEPAAEAAPVAFDQVERLNDSGASLASLLEMNRMRGW